MIVHSIRMQGITRFRSEVLIDLDDAPRPLLAVAGPNGAGKSTLLESLIVALFGTFPTRPGSIYDYCHGRDAFVEIEASIGGRRWRVLRRIDAERRKAEAHVWIDGVPVVEGKIGELDALVAAHWPPLGQILATTFAAQGGAGSFLSLLPSARKDLIVRMLGLDRLQELAEAAALEVTAARSVLALAADRADRARGRALELEAAAAELDRLEAAAAHAEAAAAEGQAAAAAAQRASQDARTAEQDAGRRRDELGVELARVADAAKVAEAAVAEAERRHKAALGAAAELEDARAAAGDLVQLREERDAAEADWRAADDAFRASKSEADQASSARTPLVRRLEDLDGRISRLPDASAISVARSRAELEERAAAEVARLEPVELASRKKRDRLATAAEQERTARRSLATAEGRAALVDEVPCGGGRLERAGYDDDDFGEIVDCSACPLLVDAVAARDALDELRDDLNFVDGAEDDQAAAAAAAEAAARDLREERRKVAALAGSAARFEAVERDAHARQELEDDRVAARAQMDAAEILYGERRAALEGLIARRTPAAARLEAARLAASKAEAARDHVAELATLAAELEGLAVRRAEAEVARDQAATLATTTRTAFDAATAACAAPRAIRLRADGELVAASAEERRTRRLAEEARRAADKAAGRREALGEIEDAAEEARAGLVAAEQAAEDAELLAAALGRNGVQAMEIDAAGPAVSSLATEILRVVYGPRFAVVLATQVLRKGAEGKRGETREAFEVQVLDAERGTDGPAERLSGGEQVVVSESIKLALSVFAAQSSGTKIRTLIRDESDGALDAERAIHYPAMLRRAVELGGFDRVLLVSHRPDNVAACDGVILVDNGAATVEVAAY